MMSEALTDAGAISSMRAVAHPTRLRILSLLTAQAMSAAEVARELDLTHANASYHLRVLHQAAELVVESEEKIRGGLAKRYRYVVLEKPSRSPATGADRRAYVEAISREVNRRQERLRKGRRTYSDIETWVRPEVWTAAVDLMAAASAMLHDNAQGPGAPGTTHVSASIFAFEMGDDS
jgi:DNA-binding transcriptional ArsR family regulator